MSGKFENLLGRIAQDDVLLNSVEEAIRQGVILPVLTYLGWNTYDVREVVPEEKVENGSPCKTFYDPICR